jgi:transcription antitermination factor NusG
MIASTSTLQLPKLSPESIHARNRDYEYRSPRLNTETEHCCFALKVRCSGEDSVARSLRLKGHHVLSPMHTVSLSYSDRIKKVRRALFPGYLFVRMPEQEFLSVVSTNGVSYMVRSGRNIEPLSDSETQIVEAACHAPEKCEPCEYLRIGQRVMIEDGAFTGLTGLLHKVRDENNVIVAIDSLHRAVRLATGTSALRFL